MRFNHLLVLVALVSVTFFFKLGARDLFDTDEGMHASTSRVMVESGDWITPTFNGENFYDKTAFFNWFIASSFLVFGFTEFAARLPAALFGLGGCLIAYALARRMFGPQRGAVVGLCSGLILATSPLYLGLSRNVVHDISLMFCVSAALASFYLAYASEERRTRHLVGFYVSCGLAVLAKGPVGAAIPGLVVLLFLVLDRRLSFLRSMGIAWGIPLALAVAGPWYLAIGLRNEDYFEYFFFKNLNHLATEKGMHTRPFYYYVPAFIGAFFPWSPFLPATVGFVRRELRGPRRSAILFLVSWVTATFLLFSVASSKLWTYILPLFPAAALLVGGAWAALIAEPENVRKRAFGWAAAFILVGASCGLGFLFTVPEERFYHYGIDRTLLFGPVGLLVGGAALATWSSMRGRPRVAFAGIAGAMISLVLILPFFFFDAANPLASSKTIGAEIDKLLAPGERMACFTKVDSVADAAVFYTGRNGIALTREPLSEFLDSEETVYCVVAREHWKDLGPLEERVHVVYDGGGRLLISNHAPDGSGG